MSPTGSPPRLASSKAPSIFSVFKAAVASLLEAKGPTTTCPPCSSVPAISSAIRNSSSTTRMRFGTASTPCCSNRQLKQACSHRASGTRGLNPEFFQHTPHLSPAGQQAERSFFMNWDRIEGNWKQLRGKVQQQWGKLTDDDFDYVEGRRVELVGKIQERYGIAKDEAERQVDSWMNNV